MRAEILVGVERRRRWTDEQKLRILAEVGIDGASVADVARRHAIARQHLYQWRAWFRRRQPAVPAPSEVCFLPVEPIMDAPPSGEPPRLEIVLANGRIVRIAGDAPDATIARLIRVAETA
ncbi:IS66-like element accessory protein TnpA [Asaia bogorensis]|uniref:IS66-like element accessory protein TnpA n=1 Tax=Asaia bogorensis TaxID=91915 RepID=UPI000EFD471F|nr:transposase [Asaia bogorensis]